MLLSKRHYGGPGRHTANRCRSVRRRCGRSRPLCTTRWLHASVPKRRAALEQAAQQAAHFARLGRLAAGVSHEIRNPLAAIFLHVDLLEEELSQPSPDGSAEIPQCLTEIRTQLTRLEELVQEYLTLVVASIQPTLQDLGAAVQTWAAEMQGLAAARGVTVRCENLTELGQVAFHASTLRRAVLNLVQNAVDAMPQGGTVTLEGQATATHIHLRVQDTGLGIPTQRLGQMFEPLYTTKPGGTGLGLHCAGNCGSACGQGDSAEHGGTGDHLHHHAATGACGGRASARRPIGREKPEGDRMIEYNRL